MKYVDIFTSSLTIKALHIVFVCWAFSCQNVFSKTCALTCTSKTCLDTSANFLRKLKLETNPCDDFYDYVCGTYPEDIYITEDVDLLQNMQSATFQMYHRLLKIVEQQSDEKSQSISSKRKSIHSSCVHFHNVEKEVRYFSTWFSDNVIATWPFLTMRFNHVDVSNWLCKLNLADEFSFFKLHIDYQSKESYSEYSYSEDMRLPEDVQETFEIHLRPERFLLMDYCPNVERAYFVEFLYDLLEMIHIPLSKSNRIIKDAIKIDDAIRNSPETSAGIGNSLVLDCKMQTRQNRWCYILNRLTNITKLDISNATLVLFQPQYFHFIDQMLRQKPKRAVANYLALRFLVNNLKSLQNFFPLLLLPCRSEIRPSSQFPDLHHSLDKKIRCLSLFTSYLPAIIVKDYILDANIEAKLLEMEKWLTMFKSVVVSFIKPTTWIEEETKDNILSTINNIKIGTVQYVDYMMNHVDSAARFRDLNPIENNFAYNLLELKRIYKIDALRTYKLGYMDSMIVDTNPFITEVFSGTEIMFGFGFFEQPHMNIGRPLYMELGIFGTIFGHEISHLLKEIFDAYDQDLMARQMENFQHCVFEKYSVFKIPEIKETFPSDQTYHEDFADMLGMQLSYQVYKNFASNHTSTNQKLPAVHLTNEQMFFVAYGQAWCEFGDKHAYRLYLEQFHSPSLYRVNGPLMNSEAFVHSFKCPLGSKMDKGPNCKLKLTHI